MKLLKIAAALALVAALAGCANLQNAVNAVSAVTVTPKQAALAVTAFVGAENTMTVILTTCTPAVRPAACNDVNLRNANKAIAAGQIVASALQTAINDNPAGPISGTDYQKVEAVITTLDNAISAYNAA